MIWDGKDAQGDDESSNGTAFLVATDNGRNTCTGYFLSYAHNIEDD
jgi:hypothetical protein